MRLLLFQISIFLFISNISFADDFINRNTKKIWKVAKCEVVGSKVRVTPCYQENICIPDYDESKYFCLKSKPCNDSFFQDFVLNKKVIDFKFRNSPEAIIISSKIAGVDIFPKTQKVVLATKNLSDREKESWLSKYDFEKSIVIYPNPLNTNFSFLEPENKKLDENIRSDVLKMMSNLVPGCEEIK